MEAFFSKVPWQIKSCFTVKMIKGNRYKAGWQVIARFEIGLHNKDLALLKQIKSFFGVGGILKQGNDAIQQMSEARLIWHMEGENNPFLGKKHSDESRNAMSEAKGGENNPMFGKNHSDETRKKMSAAKLGQIKPEGSGRPCQAIEVLDIKNNLTTQYDSIRAAAIALDIPCDSIRSSFRKNRQKPYKNRYIFKKIEKPR
jgi:group I intron endonuclease